MANNGDKEGKNGIHTAVRTGTDTAKHPIRGSDAIRRGAIVISLSRLIFVRVPIFGWSVSGSLNNLLLKRIQRIETEEGIDWLG
jgi:hypothetical protein